MQTDPQLQETMDEDMKALNGMYINACINIMAPNPGERLQVYEPFQPLPDNKILNNNLDFKPKFALVSKGLEFSNISPDLVPNLTDGFYKTYGDTILTELRTPKSELSAVLGDEYENFRTYQLKWVEDKRGTSSELVKCVDDYLIEEYTGKNPNKVRTAAMRDANNMVIMARNMYETVRDDDSKTWDAFYSRTLKSVVDEVAKGQSKTIKFNSKTSQSDVSATWAHGRMHAGYSFFSPSASVCYEDISKKIYNSEIDFSMTVGKYTTVTAEAMGGWYYKPAMTDMKNNKAAFTDETDWTKHFKHENDDYGDLAWKTSEVIVGSDITITLNIKNRDLVSDAETLKAHAEAGYWPFFTGSGKGGNTTVKVIPCNIGIQITFSTTPGTVMALGIKVSSPFDP